MLILIDEDVIDLKALITLNYCKMDVVLRRSISGLLLTFKSSKNNKLEIQHGNNNMQSHLSKVCF